MTKFWPFGQHSKRFADFESVSLPDEGREFLKPSAEMFIQELRGIRDGRRDEAVAHCLAGDDAFEKRRYREAAACYLASRKIVEGLSGYLAHGVALVMVSEFREAAEVFEAGRCLSLQRQAAMFEAAFGINLGQVYSDLGEPDRSRKILENARDLCREIGDQALMTMAFSHLGVILFVQGAYDEGITCCDCAIRISHGGKYGLAHARLLFVRGVLLTAKGDLKEAERALQEGMSWLKGLQDSYIEARIGLQLGYLYLLQGKAREAQEASEHSLDIFERISNPQGRARCLGLLALLYFSKGQDECGYKAVEQALQLDRQTGYRRGEIRQLLTRAHVCLLQGQLEDAQAMFQSADALARTIGHASTLLETIPMLTMSDEHTSEAVRITILKECLEFSKSVGVPTKEVQIELHLGSVYAACGQMDEALACCQKALTQSRTVGCRFEEARSLSVFAQVLEQKGDRELAAEHVGVAQAILQDMGISTPHSGRITGGRG